MKFLPCFVRITRSPKAEVLCHTPSKLVIGQHWIWGFLAPFPFPVIYPVQGVKSIKWKWRHENPKSNNNISSVPNQYSLMKYEPHLKLNYSSNYAGKSAQWRVYNCKWKEGCTNQRLVTKDFWFPMGRKFGLFITTKGIWIRVSWLDKRKVLKKSFNKRYRAHRSVFT